MIIAVDFDGTLSMGPYPEIGNPKPYAVEMMNKLKDDGHYIILWTCRRGERLEDALNWLLEQGIPLTASMPMNRRTSLAMAMIPARFMPIATSMTSRWAVCLPGRRFMNI